MGEMIADRFGGAVVGGSLELYAFLCLR